MDVRCSALFLECETPYMPPIALLLFYYYPKTSLEFFPTEQFIFVEFDRVWDDSSWTSLWWLLMLLDSQCNYKETESQRTTAVSLLCVWEQVLHVPGTGTNLLFLCEHQNPRVSQQGSTAITKQLQDVYRSRAWFPFTWYTICGSYSSLKEGYSASYTVC